MMATLYQRVFAILAMILLMTVFVDDVSASGSDIAFEKTPDKINPLLTPSLSLRCSLHDSAVSPTGSNHLVGRRDVTHTDDNIRLLMSLVVTRNDGVEHVASVTQLTAPRGMVDAGNLKVTGAINTGTEELGYLQLTWTYPDSSQAGTYSCEVNGMTSQGHVIVFSQSAEVEVVQPTLADLVQHIHDQDVKMVDMKQDIEASRTELNLTRQELNSVKLQLDDARHIENGTIHCGRSDSWSGASTTVNGAFAKSYKSPPIVHIGVVENKMANHDIYNSWYRLSLVNVGKDSFTVKCDRSGTNAANLYEVSFDWVSFSSE